MIQIDLYNIFQMGWFNHQLGMFLMNFRTYMLGHIMVWEIGALMPCR